MGIETGPRNEFRDSLRPDRGERLVIAEKRAKGDPSAEGLGAVKVPRSEIRRTDQRGGDRHPLAAEQIIVRRGAKSHAVKLLNLSHGGAMVESDVKVRLWDKVVLVLGDEGEIECAVRWIKDG